MTQAENGRAWARPGAWPALPPAGPLAELSARLLRVPADVLFSATPLGVDIARKAVAERIAVLAVGGRIMPADAAARLLTIDAYPAAAALLAGVLASLSYQLRIPSGEFGFASIVPLMSGSFLFAAAPVATALLNASALTPSGILLNLVIGGTTGFAVLLAMACGPVVHKLCLNQFLVGRTYLSPAEDAGGHASHVPGRGD